MDSTITWDRRVTNSTCQSSELIYKSKITLPKASKLHRCTFKISKIFLGRGSLSPLPKPLSPISLGASRLDPALCADSALRASMRASRELGALCLGARLAQTRRFALPCERTLFARPTFAPLDKISCLCHWVLPWVSYTHKNQECRLLR